ncbi:exocyst complex component sec10 [Brettanomyces bruxellensis AWRI1499]|nr:exocyst complex component sec10 [Brettanomyces bruxellensis AWRI1499]
MSSLYQLDEETKELLTLDNFLKDLSISEFVDRLSKQNVEYKSKFNNGVEYIDPKPYIRTFELVEKQLDKLNKECSETRIRIENQVHIRSLQHYKNVLQLNGKAADLDKKVQKSFQ